MTEEWDKYTLAVLENDGREITARYKVIENLRGESVQAERLSLIAALKELNKEYDRTAKPAGFTP